jgi:hypothetical protein
MALSLQKLGYIGAIVEGEKNILLYFGFMA